MSSKPHFFAIGVFVLGATILGLTGIVVVSQDAMRSPKYFIETYVDESVQGIDIGTPFKFRGVKAGTVSEILLVSSVYDTRKMYVMIRVALDDRDLMKDDEAWSAELRQMIDNGLRLKLVPQGITGLSFLEGDFFPDSNIDPLPIDWKPKYNYIPSRPAMMTLLSRTIERMSAEINTLDIKAIGNNVESISSNLNQSVIHIEKITGNAAMAADNIIANVSIAAGNLPTVSTNLMESMDIVQGILSDSTRDMDQILVNLRYITEETKEFVRMIKRNPGMLLSEPPEKKLNRERTKK